MPSIGIDPNSILRILTNTDDPNRRFPGPQNKDQLKARETYAYDLMKNMQLQGNANYVPMNALADTLRGYMGGRYLEKNDRAHRNMDERSGKALTSVTFPNYGGNASVPTLREPVMPEPDGAGATGSITKPPQPQQQEAGLDIDGLVKEAADKAGVDPTWLRAFVDIESGGNPKAGRKGSKYAGLLQLSPDESAKYSAAGVDMNDPSNQLAAGAAKLKADMEAYKAKYGNDPTPEELYMIHQQGAGGFDAHRNNPDAPAWDNMAKTAQGRRLGQKWAKQAIWGNLPKEAQQQFGDVNNVTSGQFMDLWRNRVGERIKKFTPPPQQTASAPMMPPRQPKPIQPLPPGRAQGLGFDNEAAKSMIGEEVPTDLSFDRNKIGTPGNEVMGSNVLAMSPEQAASEISSPGGVTSRAKNPMPPQMPMQGQTDVPKNVPPIPRPPEGTIPINAGIPNTDDQFAGMSQTREPEMQVTSDSGGLGDNLQGDQVDLPINPSSQIRPNQLYDVLKDPNIDPVIKQDIMKRAQEQGQMQAIPVEGGKLYYNPRTGKQLYVPEPKWGQTSVGGVSVPTISIKRKANGPWESFLMDGTPVPGGGGSSEGGQDSGSGGPQGGGGLEGLHQRGVNMDRRKQLTENQTKLQSGERETHAKAGELAEKNKVAIQRLRQLENAPDINNITTGMTAPAWNELKKTLNTWLPGTIAKEGPISIHDIYSSIATNAAAALARASDPNPSVRQFEAMLSTNPGFAQTPAGRKALLLSLEHTINLERDIGKLAKSSTDMTNPDEYNRRVEAIRSEYAKKKVIPEIFLDPKFIKSKQFKNMKWLSEGENPDDKVKVGEYFVSPEGKVMKRNE